MIIWFEELLVCVFDEAGKIDAVTATFDLNATE
jgi:hypothetical protein